MRVPIDLRFTDYDLQGHVNNAVYLTFFEIARLHAWRAISKKSDTNPFIMAEANVRYVSQAKWGDPITVEISVTEVRTKAWVWSYRVVSGADDRLVAEGRTVHVMYDYAAQRTVPIPDAIRAALSAQVESR